MAAMFAHDGSTSTHATGTADDDLLSDPANADPAAHQNVVETSFLSKSLLPVDPQTCLEDLETYTNQFDPRAACGVYDEFLEDEQRKGAYDGLPPPFGTVGGHLMFSSWSTVLKNASPATILSVMDFTRSGIYVNPSRISPSLITIRSTTGTSTTNFRMLVEGSVAISVMAGMCTESHITEAMPGAGNPPPRLRRFLCLMPHNLDWERWQSFICLVYGHRVLFSPITANAIHMGSMLSGNNSSKAT
ncbi:hypothetical protein C8J57DRAFT_1245294 [Mycena rebaudengoi]|nr:hypothetical protein C8J57DRAFT_1245294 [Mycena rebaudengoi]